MNNLAPQARSLEDAYFQKDDLFLIENLRELKRMEDNRETLTAVSGITDTVVLDTLIRLGIKPETLSSLAVIPLVAVAWADGSVDSKERAAILEAVHRAGFGRDVDLKLVGHWLESKPKPALFEAWKAYSRALAAELPTAEREGLRDQLVGHARSVAQAAGGVMGLGKVSQAEQSVLDQLEAAWN